MGLVVQKFGGTSVSSEDARKHCIRHIKKEVDQGKDVVVVVSAMGRKGEPYATDTLLSLLKANTDLPKREQDLLLSTGEIISASVFASHLLSEGIPNIVLTGGQAGIVTNDQFGDSRIIAIEPTRITQELEQGKVVIVTGFQGYTSNGDVTTLGRGGSDTTATALGAALNADVVDIFTDVEGIYTADPRIVEEAKPLHAVTYNEICNLAYLGAKVIHPRAVEMAMVKNIPIRVRSTFSDEPGTLVANFNDAILDRGILKENLVTGITQVPGITQIQVTCDANQHKLQHQVFQILAANQISVDFINVSPTGVAFTVFDEKADKAEKLLQQLGCQPKLNRHCAKVSVVGARIAGVPGVMAKVIEPLSDKGITILQSADSHTTIWVLVKQEEMGEAIRALHHQFMGEHLL